MIHTLYPSSRSSNEIVPFDHNDDAKGQKQLAMNNIKIIEGSEIQHEKIDQRLATMPNDANASVLAMIATQQKQVVLAMLGINAEQAIALALANSIEIYAQKLERIQGWTNGGVEMFRSSLMLMFDNIKADGVQPTDLEDLFQLALLEIMCNPQEYGLESWYEQNKVDISHILESTGSGSHSLHEEAWNSPEKLGAVVAKLYDGIMKNGQIPSGSFLDQVMQELGKAGGGKAISDQIIKGWKDEYGWWLNKGGGNININDPTSATVISPMLRLFLLSSLLENQSMSKEEVELILTGSLEDVDKFVKDKFELDDKDVKYSSASLNWLEANTTWRMLPDGRLDWLGSGIDLNDLVNLYSNFPGRELSEDELEEINRIGDQVKMIQQTLKYWFQICKDEQLAIARNI
ncbi:hypothetical protein [Photorhabdus heterorhabditis]|uniref:hypothetical protein n=1 Tax=Photorhabdus heterorhabditis TaxID=880156 RepID=UPI001BD4D910|nr:hypothetical protein [Photorhabdus heterorhabditis]MBS9441025.1 hypothetical protein [Photorhabdus heterorhabditis]